MANSVYFGGLPTAPWVKKLEAEFPDVESIRGTVIPHSKIEAIIKVSREKEPNRYKTIVDSWVRKVFRNTQIVIDGRGRVLNDDGEVAETGLRVTTHNEQVEYGCTKRKEARAKIRRGHTAVAATDEDKLTPEMRKVREHEMFGLAKIHALMAEIKKPKLPSPKDDLPQAAAVN